MRILDIRELTVPLSGNISNAVVSFTDHTVSLIALISDQTRAGKPLVGFGFNSIGRYGQAGILRERMIPRLLGAVPETLLAADHSELLPAAVLETAMRNEKPGGHGDRAGAAAALELAAWDLNAKLADEPAWSTIARSFGNRPSDSTAAVYAAGGYYHSGNSRQKLREELQAYLDLGFDAFKIKIGGASLAEDLTRIDAALEIAGSGGRLAVDANGRFDLAAATTYAAAIDDLNLRWFEEPGDPLNYALNRATIGKCHTPVATGENLFSAMDAKNLITFGGMRPERDIFQMDPGLSYGLTEYARMLTDLEDNGFKRKHCFPHGGHLINLHIAVGLGLGGCEAYPGVFQPFGGYPPTCMIDNGRVAASDAPGFGLEEKPELRDYLVTLTS